VVNVGDDRDIANRRAGMDGAHTGKEKEKSVRFTDPTFEKPPLFLGA